eukprot:CAMPEP_0201592824 /NCGR_PEP_ID=MMETSP0190_2-20130828/190609_1 /ASSEMBLY_ACC=CAM_ASM_000263 /TAXON_ID=37353 /ORGANISM="Rosalina sp." /LENGTH=256 /DNA_ID=CAMNT_0048051763 /DNA_START=33 /DNA_END=800 /DNA_ORIENTATION=+
MGNDLTTETDNEPSIELNPEDEIEDAPSSTMEDSKYDDELEKECPDAFFCPITREIMTNPVILISDGHTYERAAIEEWFNRGHSSSPMTGEQLTCTRRVPNYAMSKAIDEYLTTHQEYKRKKEIEEEYLLRIIKAISYEYLTTHQEYKRKKEMEEEYLLRIVKAISLRAKEVEDMIRKRKTPEAIKASTHCQETINGETLLYKSIKPGQCKGDPNKVLNILNEYEPLQHNEYKEYDEDVPGLGVELYDYQNRGVSW